MKAVKFLAQALTFGGLVVFGFTQAQAKGSGMGIGNGPSLNGVGHNRGQGPVGHHGNVAGRFGDRHGKMHQESGNANENNNGDFNHHRDMVTQNHADGTQLNNEGTN